MFVLQIVFVIFVDVFVIVEIYVYYVFYGIVSFEIELFDVDEIVVWIDKVLEKGWFWLVV